MSNTDCNGRGAGSRFAERARLWATASIMALGAAGALVPHDARAASFTAGNEAQLDQAIADAITAGGSSSITLTNDFAVTNPVPAVNANGAAITLDMAGHALTGAAFTNSGTGALAYTFTDGGAVHITGAGSVLGGVTVTGSTLQLENGGQQTFNGTSPVTGTIGVSGAGSQLTVAQLQAGQASGATTIQIDGGGVLHASSAVTLGAVNGAQVNLSVTGPGSQFSEGNGTFSLGAAGTSGQAAVTISNGGSLTNGVAMNDGGATATGVSSILVTGAGSTLSSHGGITLLRSSLSVQDGGAVSSGNFALGSTTSNGSLQVSGAGSTLTLTNALTVTGTGSGGGVRIDTGGAVSAASAAVTNSSLDLESGGTLTTTGAGTFNGSSLTVNGAGSLFTASQLVISNTPGTTTVLIENGGVVQTGATTSNFALNTGAVANVTVTGAGSKLNLGSATLGSGANAAANVTVSAGGSMTTTSTFNFGSPSSGGPSNVTLTDAGSNLSVLKINLFDGELDVLNGAQANVAGLIDMGANNTATAIVVSGAGSTLTTTGDVQLGQVAGVTTNSGSTVTLTDGGALTVGGAIDVGSAATRVGVLNIGAAPGSAATGAGTLNATSLVLAAGTGTLNFNHTDTNYTFATPISGGGALNQMAGVTHLTGDSSGFTGQTTVSGGTLAVDGMLGASGGAVAVQGGGALGGSGTINGSVTVVDGVLAPGDSPGTLTITGNLTLASASHLSMQFGQAGVVGGALNDQIVVGGNLILAGVLDVSASPGGIFGAGIYRIASYGGTLTDNGLALGAIPTGSQLAIQTAIAGQVNLVNYTGVPVNFWDGAGLPNDDVIAGGAGAWTTTGANWTLANGAYNAAYDPTALAIFAAAPGTVTVNGPVSAAGMQFAVDGYHLTGDAITLTGGASSTIRVGDGSAAGANYVATIDNVLTGATMLTKTDLGTLVLTATETFTGGATVAGGTLQLGAGGNSGAITGAVADNGTLAFDRSDAVTFAGTISGTGSVSQIGGGTTILTGANSYSGGTTISAGVLRGAIASFGTGAILDNAALVIDQPADASFGGAINGSGSFTKMGVGQLTLTGTGGLGGPTTVAVGTLAMTGSLASSAFTVLSGATLAGSGAVGATTIQSGASIAPVNLGTLRVNGAFVQQAGSTYQVTVDPTSNASSQIAVSGAASVQAGASLNVTKTNPGNYRLGAVYTLVSAGGGLSGTYGYGQTPISAFLALKDAYDAGHAYLTVVQTADPSSVATNPNEAGAASGLPSSGDLTTGVLNSPTDDAAAKLLAQLAGDGHAAARGVLVSDSRLVRDLAIDRVQGLFCSSEGLGGPANPNAACPEDERPSAWGQAFSGWGHTDGDANAGSVNRTTGGFLIGADTAVAGTWRAGAFAGFSHTDLMLDGNSASADIDSYHLGAYGGTQAGRLGLRFGASYTFHDVHTGRQVQLPGLPQQLQADYGADTAQGFGQAGYRLDIGKASVEPFVEAAYVSVHANGFTERGGVAALTGQAANTDAIYSTLGFKPSLPLAFGEVQASLHGLFGWRHDYSDLSPVSTVRFAAGGSPFAVQGAPLERDEGLAEVGLDMKNDNAVVGITYGAEGWRHDFDQTVRVNLRLDF